LQLADDELPSASLRGQLFDADGEPRPLQIAKLVREGWEELERLRADEGGVFVRDGLAAGTYWLLAFGPGEPRCGPFVLGPGQQLDVGALRLPRAGRLVVAVRSEPGFELRRPVGWLQTLDGSDREWLLRPQGGD